MHGHLVFSPLASSSLGGFTLVELLTVLFIISLLVGILIPSLNAARNAAKKAGTKAVMRAIEVGLESFKNDNEREFRSTNGYPPSFAHPQIPGATFDPYKGEFPFLTAEPVVYGAHWLPAMLLGLDGNGYAPRRNVPDQLRDKPEKWYETDPNGKLNVERRPLYLDPKGLRLVATKNLPGKQPVDDMNRFFPNYGDETSGLDMKELPVIVDSFEQPILYYAANAFGKPGHIVAPTRSPDNDYGDRGQPYYFHQDNIGFTGDVTGDGSGATGHAGWFFGDKGHAIAHPGSKATAGDKDDHDKDIDGGFGAWTGTANPELNRKGGETFANFILDRQALQTARTMADGSGLAWEDIPLQPVNKASYLLISAGVDGRYGTVDDVTNFVRE